MSQLDFFQRTRRSRLQMMVYADLGWTALGRAAQFRCEKCQRREWRQISDDTEAFAGVPCDHCNRTGSKGPVKRRFGGRS